MTTLTMRPVVSLVELLRERAAGNDGVAFRFGVPGEPAEVVTYAELDRSARAIAAALQARGHRRGDRAMLLYPPGLEYVRAFFGTLYAGLVPVPAYPPTSKRGLGRIAAIVADATPAVAMTAQAGAADPGFAMIGLSTLDTEAVDVARADDWIEHHPAGTDLAFLQYTSGSTARPKGVALRFENLLHNVEMISEAFGCTPASRAVIWLPPFHDMGLIGGILTPLYAGFPVTLMSPASFLARPARWLEAISAERAEVSGGPNFAYELCIAAVDAAAKADLDLSTWRVAFNGAEPIRAETLDRFAEAFAPCGFRREAFLPCYGLAEATLFVTGARLAEPPLVLDVHRAGLETGQARPATSDAPALRLVSSGRPRRGQQVSIVDPQTATPVEPGNVGEIWVSGPSVASGYWNAADASQETFGATLGTTARFLRTGDLGFVRDGELFVTGRRKDLIIVRGRNFYPSDVERVAEASHPSLRTGCGVAVTIDRDGEPVVALLHEVSGRAVGTLRGDEVAIAVRGAVMDALDLGIDEVALFRPGRIPKTSSGKVQRSLAAKLYQDGTIVPLWRTGDPVAPPSLADAVEPAEEYVRRVVAEQLRTTPDVLAVDQTLRSLGIDSLGALRLANRIADERGATVSIGELLGGASILNVAAALGAFSAAPDDDAGKADPTEVSYGQRSLWHLQQSAPDSPAYHIPAALRLRGSLDVAALRRALDAVVARHPMLRTRYVADAEALRAVVDPAGPVALEIVDGRDWSPEQEADDLDGAINAPFDLARDPMLRLRLVRRGDGEHILLAVVHHIAADLWSLSTIVEELGQELGDTPTGIDPAASYADFVAQERRLADGPAGDRHEAFWREQLAGALPVLELPTDGPRPPVRRMRGAELAFTIAADDSDAVRAAAKANGVTVFTQLLAGFHLALHALSGQDTVVVGTPTANRAGSRFDRLVGYCVNPVAILSRIEPDRPIGEVVAANDERVIAALDHQAYPFPVVVERLRPPRPSGHTPVFQAMFGLYSADAFSEGARMVLGGAGAEGVRWGELTATPVAVTSAGAQFDVMLTVVDAGGALRAKLQYDTDLFAPATAERIAGLYRQMLHSLHATPEASMAQLREDLVNASVATPVEEEAADHRYVAPRTETERDLAAIWAEVIGVDRVGIQDDLYELGGHSLLAVQLQWAIRQRFQVEVPVKAVMQARTVAESAAYVDALMWARDSAMAAATRGSGEEGEL